MPDVDLLTRVRSYCLSLPDTEESSRLGGEPHFYVGGKIFAGCGREDGIWCVGMKVGLELQSLLVTQPGFRVAKYVGKHGWVTVEAKAVPTDKELHRLLQISYDLITGGSASKMKPSKAAPRKAAAPAKRKAAAPAKKPAKKAAKKPVKKRGR
jgi:predicted DNA-binding protein (MmcQ/YjbR family)